MDFCAPSKNETVDEYLWVRKDVRSVFAALETAHRTELCQSPKTARRSRDSAHGSAHGRVCYSERSRAEQGREKVGGPAETRRSSQQAPRGR